ncbi:hypothetical protein BOX15_Mlig032788g1 [Macrostomum lignano]|uniref:Uncharacterized protein n=1 Tax=Macrostomum lignano TaxID=282301 RepID=A0A267G761_9PLAT|nr:hypothetical protein BOX15_Mlig032788g1 [Macrostomum lignano]
MLSKERLCRMQECKRQLQDGCCVHPSGTGCKPATDDVECTMLSAIAGDATIDPGVPIEEPNLASSRGADNAADISIDFI